MVRRRLTFRLVVCVFVWGAASCGRERDMPEEMDIPDTMPIMRAMEDAAVRDSMLDVMPGGEMARGDSTASMELLKQKR